jgi:hypothetical protein
MLSLIIIVPKSLKKNLSKSQKKVKLTKHHHHQSYDRLKHGEMRYIGFLENVVEVHI